MAGKRGPKPAALPCLVLLAALAAGLTACGHREMDAHRNPEVPIRHAATFAWNPHLADLPPEERDLRVHNALLHERIRSAIASVLAEKSFRQADATTADLLVEYRVGVKNTRRDATEFVSRRNPAAPPTSGPAVILASGPMEATEGELLIRIVERETGRVAYWAVGRNDHVTQGEASERAIHRAIRNLLADLE